VTEEQHPETREELPACWLLMLIAILGLAVVLWAATEHILGFLAMSYALLATGLSAIWTCPPALVDKESIDPDSLTVSQIKATAAILAMATLLGAASMIAYGVTPSSPAGQDHGDTNQPSVSGKPNKAINLTSGVQGSEEAR